MTALQLPDWSRTLVPDQSLAESFLRGCLIYIALVILFRLVLKRQTGGVCLTDVMLAVLVSECVSNALTQESNSIPNGLAAVLGLLVCNYLADVAQYKWEWFRRLTESEPVELIRDGHLLRENLAQERICEQELLGKLREQGIGEVERVKFARIESDGKVSVIPEDELPMVAPTVHELAALTNQLRILVARQEALLAESKTGAR